MKKLFPLLALLVCIFERGRTLTCMRKMQLIVPRGIAATNIRKWESATTRRFITGLPAVPSGEDEYWSRQKELIQEMQDTVDKEKSSEQKVKFAERQRGLVFDTAYIGFLISCILWIYFENPFVTISYALGSSLGLAYAYGLGKYVETIGGSTADPEAVQGAGVGQARFAFLILLFVLVGKFRGEGLLEIPAISGFFTYQLASLRQGLKEYND